MVACRPQRRLSQQLIKFPQRNKRAVKGDGDSVYVRDAESNMEIFCSRR